MKTSFLRYVFIALAGLSACLFAQGATTPVEATTPVAAHHHHKVKLAKKAHKKAKKKHHKKHATA